VTLADAHPGPLVTEVYAEEMFRFLKDNGLLDQLHRERDCPQLKHIEIS